MPEIPSGNRSLTRVVEDQPTSGPIPWTDDMDLIHRNPNKVTSVNTDRWGSATCDPGFAGYNNPGVNPKRPE